MDDNEIDKLYHAKRDEPPPALDDAVLAMAQSREPETRKPWLYRRAPLLGTAAVLVLSVSVFLTQPDEENSYFQAVNPTAGDAPPVASPPVTVSAELSDISPSLAAEATPSPEMEAQLNGTVAERSPENIDNAIVVTAAKKSARSKNARPLSRAFAADMNLIEEVVLQTQPTIEDPDCSEAYVLPEGATLREDEISGFVLKEENYQVTCIEQQWQIDPPLADAP